MNLFIFESVFQIAFGVFFIWGIFNEPILAELEKKLFKNIQKKFSRI